MIPPKIAAICILIALLVTSCIGKESRSGSESRPTPFFAKGIWFPKEQVDALKSGRIKGEFMWHFSWFTFETSRNHEHSPSIKADYLDMTKDLNECGTEWCVEGEKTIEFIASGEDTIARFSADGLEGDHLYQRVTPPDLTINDYPDWVWRKLFFAQSYKCRYPRIDSSFSLSLDENGRVTGTDTWSRYEFHDEHDWPVLVFYNTEGQMFPYMMTTYSGEPNSFNLHEVLNAATLFDAADGEVEIGGLRFEFDGVVEDKK
jgi:hypothetical protein